jgi:hypothetical protein
LECQAPPCGSAFDPSFAVTTSRGPRSGGTCKGQRRAQTFEPGANFFRHGRDFRIAGHLQHRDGVHEGDDEAAKAERQGRLKGADKTKVVSAEQMEISRLRAELARVKMERDILGKATAYFAKAQS